MNSVFYPHNRVPIQLSRLYYIKYDKVIISVEDKLTRIGTSFTGALSEICITPPSAAPLL